jgi:hypothetical protein
LADRVLVADAPLAPLAPFAIAESSDPLPDRYTLLTEPGDIVCRSTGWLAGAWRNVAVWRHRQGLLLRVEGVGEFAVTTDGIAVIGPEVTPVAVAALAEALLGAPLVLALALQGVWSLHASALSADGQVIAFAGESGNGKSTLAACLNDAGQDGWRRVADDALPVSIEADGVVALPHFPQLKLTDVEQYPVDAPSSLPLAAVYVIGPQTAGQDSVSLQRLGQRQAMQALIRHTVAARLFDQPLLAAHLDFCAEAAARIPVWRLAHPHRREVLPQVCDAIHRSVSGSPAGSDSRVVIAHAGR